MSITRTSYCGKDRFPKIIQHFHPLAIRIVYICQFYVESIFLTHSKQRYFQIYSLLIMNKIDGQRIDELITQVFWSKEPTINYGVLMN